MRIGIAAAFRHCPEKDGQHGIPASELVRRDFDSSDEYLKKVSPDQPPVWPILGYLAYTLDGKKVLWSFMRYEAPQFWDRKRFPDFHSRGCGMGTCNVYHYTCKSCGRQDLFPFKGTSHLTCPFCAEGPLTLSKIDIPSAEFDGMLGDLRDPLANEAIGVFNDSGAGEFEFPMVVAGGPGIEPSPSVPAAAQGAAQALGYGLRPVSEIPSLKEWPYSSTPFLSIMPEITSGILDSEEVEDGKAWRVGCLSSWVKLYVPKPRNTAPMMSCVRF